MNPPTDDILPLSLRYRRIRTSLVDWEFLSSEIEASECLIACKDIMLLRASMERVDPKRIHMMKWILPGFEQERADRFRQSKDHNVYVGARWLLRSVLGNALGLEPGELRIECDRFGKPFLADVESPYQFNLSHTRNEIALVFSSEKEVGVDIESFEMRESAFDIAERFFHPEEVRDLLSVEGEERQRTFTRLWTLKEAIIKALGKGLSLPLNSFRVPSAMFFQGEEGLVDVGKDTLRVFPLTDEPVCAGAVAERLR